MRLPSIDPQIDQSVVRMDFSPRKMVDWFSPIELARTGGRLVLAEIFGSYADKREVQAALYSDTQINPRYLDKTEMWFDYIADVGDGFDSTYTLAYLLAKPEIHDPAPAPGGPSQLRRGEVLFFGGDQVYPTASRAAYRERMIGPYSCSFPELRKQADGVDAAYDLFAIPGNHDWYDGLTSFVRTFCQHRKLGQWQTQQRRSYFSVPLPHDWWVWGIDIQLEADIDDPQLEYFRKTAEKMCERCRERHPKLILITAEPAWVYAGHPPRVGTIEHLPAAFENLAFFLRETVAKFGLDIRLMMAGDLHHYARYTCTSAGGTSSAGGHTRPAHSLPLHFITAGGGGAYLVGTHHLPDRLTLQPSSDGSTVPANPVEFEHRASYPTRCASWTRSFGCFVLPLWSPVFSMLVGSVYLLFAWQLQSSSRIICPITANLGDPRPSSIIASCWASPSSVSGEFTLIPSSLMDVLLEGHSVMTAMWWIARASLEAPSLLVEVGVFWWLLFAFCTARPAPRRVIVTTLHAAMHVALTAVAVWIGAMVVASCYPAGGPYYSGQGRTAVFGSFMVAFGAIIGTLVFAAYLWVCAHFVTGAPHMNEVFAARRCKDLKHFVRFHLDQTGQLNVYVVAVDRVFRALQAAKKAGSVCQPTPEPKCRIVDRFAL